MAFLNSEDIIEISNFLRKEKFKFEGKTILLTGGRGFLGRYFTDIFFYFNKKVFSKPCKLISIDNMITSGNMGSKIYIRKSKKLLSCPAFAKKVTDKIGTGDTMLAFLSVAIYNKFDFNFSMFVSALSAATNIQYMGNSVAVKKINVIKALQSYLS